MSFLRQLLATVADPLDDRYYPGSYSTATTSGVQMSAETALKISTVYACDRLLAETIASLPAHVFENLSDDSRRRAANHPLYDLLHRQPNEQQTAFEFFDFMTHCAVMRGNAYAQILPGKRGFADQIVPLHPDRVVEERISGAALGIGPGIKLRYKVKRLDGGFDTLNDGDVLHLRGMSSDGITGTSVVNYGGDSFGQALAADRYGARFFRNNAEPGGVLQTDKKLSPEGAARLKDSWYEMHSGARQHSVAILEEGLKWNAVGLTNKDSQLLESRVFQAEDVCRWFRVPPHMVGLTSKATSWGSGIEQLGLGFITYTLMPWLIRWQQAITRDLILVPDKYFVEFLPGALVRGDLKGRYDAYEIGVRNGWLSVNDVRRKENENPIEGGDVYNVAGGQAQSMTEAQRAELAGVLVRAGYKPEDAARYAGLPQMATWGVPPVTVQQLREPAPAAPGKAPAAPPTDNAHYEQLVYEAAGRIVRKEAAALSKATRRYEIDGSRDGWAAAAKEFYTDHAQFVAQVLRVPEAAAQSYVNEALRDLAGHGPAALVDWETRRAADLVALVWGGK